MRTARNGNQLTPLVWFYFNEMYPPMHDGHRPLDPPEWWTRIFEGRPQAEADEDDGTDGTDVPADPIDHDMAAAAAPEVH